MPKTWRNEKCQKLYNNQWTGEKLRDAQEDDYPHIDENRLYAIQQEYL